MKETSKTILITGASSGFGRDMAETLAADAHKGLQHLAGDRSNLAVGCARLGITRLLSLRKQVGRICARLHQHDIDAKL